MKHSAAEAGEADSADAKQQRRIAAVKAGDRAVVARAITAIENDMASAGPLLEALAPDVGRAHVVGITGAPGAGKSTLINALLHEYTGRGRRVAVVAVDPSSPISGGAVLGDRIRMSHAGAADVFIRSLASRGHLGGVSRTTRRVVDLLDAAGFDPVIVETVGAGQSEVEIARIADTSIVVCPPGLGDDIQAIKAGILEIADVLVVNKGDLAHADRTVRELTDALHLRARRAGWQVPVLRTVATTGEGIAALVDSVSAHGAEAGVGRRLRPATPAGATPAGATPAGATPAGSTPGGATIARGARERVFELSARDAFGRRLGIECIDAGPGTATVRMRIDARHLNFNGTCHGGAIFSLADCAFGLASNSHGVIAAGIDAHITYNVAVRESDVLTARAVEASRGAKLAVYRIDVTNAAGVAVSAFTGTVFVTRRHHDGAAASAPVEGQT